MRRIVLTLSILVSLSDATFAETIKLTVNGMVCAFCATSIEKTFKKEPGVTSVKIDLEKKLVTIKTKPGQTITDKKIAEVINYSGYTFKGVIREK